MAFQSIWNFKLTCMFLCNYVISSLVTSTIIFRVAPHLKMFVLVWSYIMPIFMNLGKSAHFGWFSVLAAVLYTLLPSFISSGLNLVEIYILGTNLSLVTELLVTDLISVLPASRYSLRTDDNGILLDRPRSRTKKTMGDCSFMVAAPFLWNTLPLQARQSTNLNTFKSAVKTFLFSKVFS